MTTDLHTMQAMATAATSGRVPTETNDAWPSSGSTTSLTMDDDDGEFDDGADDGSASRKYERKTRRFAWPDDLHRLFVAAIFDLGLKNASPKALMPFMQPTATSAGLTTEHLKSHLQKYRQNYDKSRAEFLAFFDESAKKNGRRRRRTAKCTESHTRFIFPITPCPPGDPAMAGPADLAPTDGDLKMDASMERADASPQPPYYPPQGFAQITPRSRLDRANLLRLAQQNAAVAFAAQSAASGYGAALSSSDAPPSGVDGVTDAQWGMLATLLSPQVAAANAASGGGGAMPAAFALNDTTSPDMQLQMHLAMQAQMNLHRQMLNRKVAVSQHYYNQAAAIKRAAASAMVERALQNHAANNAQQQIAPPPTGRYSDPSGRYHGSSPTGRPHSRPSPGNDPAMQHQHHQQMMLQQQQHLNQSHQQPQRYATSSQADALLGPPWDPMDIDMNLQSDDQSDLFGFLKSNE